ncbi:MAG TPA: hypothetical protein VGV39_01050 [Mesorhizobium sp.]|jgi:hypothetical protein|uniref:DUF7694 domain-containing protein n=1 Tax=Mesorhizobium sp. TaxID=1871066 RepID=UPI002DDD1EA3|nr:hypothetical protein [Mesorhizobium sp.]HEV2501629.1 hypothetical protein [Mesorhizobium sp.]
MTSRSRPIITRADAGWPEEWTAASRVYLDWDLCLLSVEHDGSITWDELQAIKNNLAGGVAVTIEVYPPADRVVNNIAMRHLWLLGDDEWWPDLGREGEVRPATLRDRYLAAQLIDGDRQ